jgi:RNA 3'-terminal phosphate cyclase (ATP)
MTQPKDIAKTFPISIDGSQGEGGGQILRSALALSMVTGKPFHMENIRAKRPRPGLLRQHLTAVNAAVTISQATVTGNALGSRSLTFEPGTVRPGGHHFAVGTAGSATLVLQTVLPALILGTEPSRLVLEGGTHNPFAPPFDFLQKAFLPLINRMGPRVTATLERYGFHPAGGGRMTIDIIPVERLTPLQLTERGPIHARAARAIYSALSPDVADRELTVVAAKLGWAAETLCHQPIRNATCPGNILLIEVESENLTEVFTGFGERGVRAEAVAESAANQAREYLASTAAVGEHLADQLLLPIALAGAGVFTTTRITRHAETNMEIIARFLDAPFEVTPAESHVSIALRKASCCA